MYANFYGFRENPFSLLPDPEFLYLSPQHEHALNLLHLAIINRSGFCAISGPAGTGKTTLIRALLTRLDSNICTGLITDTHASFSELLERVLNAFELDCPEKDDASRYKHFTDFVIRQYAANRNVLLIVDEAQNLSTGAMEQLRMLSNINADKHMMIQIMLIGQESLQDKLQSPALEQLAQRVEANQKIAPLSASDTCAYIQHRINKAGGQERLFDGNACKLIHQKSGGVPRIINRICDLVLVYGYAAHTREITAAMVAAASAEPLSDDELLPQTTAQNTRIATPQASHSPGNNSAPADVIDARIKEPVTGATKADVNDTNAIVAAKREAMTKAAGQKAAAMASLKEKLAATQLARQQAESLSTAAQRAETEARHALETQLEAEQAAAKLITAEKLLAAELADSLAQVARQEADNAAAMNAAALNMAQEKEALATAATEQAAKAKADADEAAVAEIRILMEKESAAALHVDQPVIAQTEVAPIEVAPAEVVPAVNEHAPAAPKISLISQEELATVTRLAAQARARKKRKSNWSLLAASVSGIVLISWMTLKTEQPEPVHTAATSVMTPVTPIETPTPEIPHAQTTPPKTLSVIPAELPDPVTARVNTEPDPAPEPQKNIAAPVSDIAAIDTAATDMAVTDAMVTDAAITDTAVTDPTITDIPEPVASITPPEKIVPKKKAVPKKKVVQKKIAPEKPPAPPIRKTENKKKAKTTPKRSVTAQVAPRPARVPKTTIISTGTIEYRRAQVARLLEAQRNSISAYEEDPEPSSEN